PPAPRWESSALEFRLRRVVMLVLRSPLVRKLVLPLRQENNLSAAATLTGSGALGSGVNDGGGNEVGRSSTGVTTAALAAAAAAAANGESIASSQFTRLCHSATPDTQLPSSSSS
ncbi:hypothetical protein Vretimale_9881, partial [Volvox reticuliferus]